MAEIKTLLDQRDVAPPVLPANPPNLSPNYSVHRRCPKLGDVMVVYIEDGVKLNRVTFTVNAIYEELDPDTNQPRQDAPIYIMVPVTMQGAAQKMPFRRDGDTSVFRPSETKPVFADWLSLRMKDAKRTMALYPPDMEWSDSARGFVKKTVDAATKKA